jgi:ribonuclease G
MSKGAYLIIEHTEALHVIDVNSGNRSNKATNQEDTAMEVNMIALPKSQDNYVFVIWAESS